MRGRRIAVATLTVASLLVAVPPAATGDAGLTIHTPRPLPGDVVSAGEVAVHATIGSDADLVATRLFVDGAAVPDARLSDRDVDGNATFGAVVALTDGDHEVRIEVEDAAGRATSRTWTLTATDRETRRLSGDTRLETAVTISQATFPDDRRATAAVLARADDFADALAGVPLAVAVDGPLLLTYPESLDEPTADELTRVLLPGATVHLLGGTAALDDQVADDVADLGFLVTRHAGEDRYATAAAVADALPPSTGAVIASGTSFPDALAASAPASRDGLPILLTRRDALPDATAEALSRRGAESATIIGGTAVVSEAVAEAMTAADLTVTRLAGDDRYATAVAVHDAYYDEVTAVALASGVTFPDALTGTRHAAATGLPLLLTRPDGLPTATDEAVRVLAPSRFTVYGGPAAVSDDVSAAAIRAAIDGVGAPRIVDLRPAGDGMRTYVGAAEVMLDRSVAAAGAVVHVEVGGREVAGTLTVVDPEPAPDPDADPGPDAGHGAAPDEPPGTRFTLTLDPLPAYAYEQPQDGVVTFRAGADGDTVRGRAAFTYVRPDPVFATAGDVELHLPSANVEMIGFHQSTRDGARQMDLRDTATATMTLPSRGRGTGRETAADIVADPSLPIVAPATGRVVRAGSYVLYCRYRDDFLVIEPDSQPGWEVKLLHFEGLSVATGDRVVAGETVVGTGPRQLPFESQVDEFSDPRDWPHVHLETVDPSIPERPGGGGGC